MQIMFEKLKAVGNFSPKINLSKLIPEKIFKNLNKSTCRRNKVMKELPEK